MKIFLRFEKDLIEFRGITSNILLGTNIAGFKSGPMVTEDTVACIKRGSGYHAVEVADEIIERVIDLHNKEDLKEIEVIDLRDLDCWLEWL